MGHSSLTLRLIGALTRFAGRPRGGARHAFAEGRSEDAHRSFEGGDNVRLAVGFGVPSIEHRPRRLTQVRPRYRHGRGVVFDAVAARIRSIGTR